MVCYFCTKPSSRLNSVICRTEFWYFADSQCQYHVELLRICVLGISNILKFKDIVFLLVTHVDDLLFWLIILFTRHRIIVLFINVLCPNSCYNVDWLEYQYDYYTDLSFLGYGVHVLIVYLTIYVEHISDKFPMATLARFFVSWWDTAIYVPAQ